MEEMNELFYRDPYCREFDAVCVSCEKTKRGWEVILEDTAFYPEGGGQPGDHGTLNGIRVLDTRRIGGQVVHITEQEIPAGTAVHGEIDWERRFDHMQNHTGEHIVSGLIHINYGYDNVGFHMGDILQLDFDGEVTFEMMRNIERQANRIIWRDLPVQIAFPSQEELDVLEYRSKKELTGTVRIVTVPDADICACCGTHLKRTGEVGVIHLLSCTKHGNGTRIEMLAGNRALTYLEGIADQNTGISHLLSAKPLETLKAVTRLNEMNGELKYRMNGIMSSYLQYKVQAMEESDGTVVMVEDGLDSNAMRQLCNMIIEAHKAGVVAVLASNDKVSCRYLIMSSGMDLKDVCRTFNQKLNGKGGGRGVMVQGTYNVPASEAMRVLERELQ